VQNDTSVLMSESYVMNGTNRTLSEFIFFLNGTMDFDFNVTPGYTPSISGTLSVPFVGRYFDVKSNISNSNISWVLMRMYYNDSEIPVSVDKSSFGAYHFSSSGNSWSRYDSSVSGVNTTGYYVWVNLSTFDCSYSVGPFNFTEFAFGGLYANGYSCTAASQCSGGYCCSSACSASACSINPPSSSGGGGGGGGGAAPSIPAPVDITSNLTAYHDVRADIYAKGSILFVMLGENHTVKPLSWTDNSALLTISSDPFNVTLNTGQSRGVDFNGDRKNDVNIRLLAVAPDHISLEVSLPVAEMPSQTAQGMQTPQGNATNETVPVQQGTPEPTGSDIVWWLIASGAVIAVVLGIVLKTGLLEKISYRQ